MSVTHQSNVSSLSVYHLVSDEEIGVTCRTICASTERLNLSLAMFQISVLSNDNKYLLAPFLEQLTVLFQMLIHIVNVEFQCFPNFLLSAK